MSYIILNDGARVEGGPYPKLAKAKREAVRFFRRTNPGSLDNYSEIGWQQMRNGSHSLWYDDASATYHTGIIIAEDS